MAKYNVTYRCGHSTVTSLYGPVSGRNRQIAAMEGSDCWECEKAKAAEQGREIALSVGLPDLQGSEKQVAWALQIRGRFVREVQAAFMSGAQLPVHMPPSFYQELFWAKLTWGKSNDATSKARRRSFLAWAQEQDMGDSVSGINFPKSHQDDLHAAAYSLLISWASEAELAKWWIDWREELGQMIGEECQEEWLEVLKAVLVGGDAEAALAEAQARVMAEAQAKEQQEREEAEFKAEAEAECAVRVEGGSKHLAIIKALGSQCSLFYPVWHEELRQLLRGKGFEWDSAKTCWYHSCPTPELACEMVAEIGHHALALKIGISIQDEELRGKALRGEYTPQPVGLVDTNADKGFRIKWEHRADLYDSAKSIRGARWDKGLRVMAVPLGSFEEVADFAKRANVRLTASAERLIYAQREALASALTVPAPVIVAPKPGKPGVPQELDEPVVVVLDSLRDDMDSPRDDGSQRGQE